MAIGVLLNIPGGTQEQYEEINQKAFGDPKGPSEPIQGLIVHTAGATTSGFRIFDVWETQEDFDRFNNEFIMPAVEGMDLPQIPPETYELANLIAAGVTARTT
jgi:hypothetical protein